ncbi:ExeM/NucH family extracellular endonuclease [Arthrobacter sp. TMN-50]
MKNSSWKGGLGAVIAVGLLASPVVALPAYAAPNGVVINEAYVNGGSANAPYLNKFVELHNTTNQPVDVTGWSLQYRAAGTSTAPTGVSTLSGIIPADGHYLIGGTSNADNGAALPATDATIAASFAGGGGTLILSNEAEAIDPLPTGSIINNPAVEDLLGYGSSNTFETAVATKPDSNSDPRSLNRTEFADTDDNSADFSLREAVTPTNADGETGSVEPQPEPEPPVAGAVIPIADIQGTGDASPLAGDTVTTRGVITASYPTGGIDGYVIQTEGTGIEAGAASDGIFIYSPATVADVAIGDHVEVTGQVGENFGVTQIEVVGGAATVLTEPAEEVKSLITPWPATNADREVLESMLVRPTGDFTVSDNYDLNRYGEIDLAFGTEALVQPTEIAPPGTEENDAVRADNSARGVTLDDGALVDFVRTTDQALPYLTVENPVRVNGSATFTSDVLVDFDFGVWRFQPVTRLTAENAAEIQPVTFAGERPGTPTDVGGDIKIASFNVLNYFSTTGDELTGCTYYNDRAGSPITVRSGCDARGAANTDSFERQEAKIVAALTNLDADMVSLEEIENSAAFGKERDEALATLTAALNEVEPGVWDFVPSPAGIPVNEDVIRNAFIYKTAAVETVGDSVILDDDVAFANARKPLAQAFQVAGDDESTKFLAIVNHFKSKGSGSGENADQGDGQGASNPDRIEQATALVDFAETMQEEAGTEKVFLTGDFNSYSAEDPMQVFYEAGYINQGVETGKYSYVFGGQSGSLDHILASPEADATVTGVDIWNINAVESLALEYSRFNYNTVNYYTADQYRASDHDPVIVGLDFDEPIEFTDIAGNEHQDHIEWMAENGLSTGWLEADGTRTYRPLANINRDAMAAFLYRLAGEPDFDLPKESPFSDVDFPANEADRVEHFDAIMWMHQSGLSTGWPEADGTRTFRPVTPVNRDAMAAFMKRFAGEVCLDATAMNYANPAGPPFSDVPEGMMFEKEISWMKDTGISEGWGDGTYRPVTPVARDAMAAFVNRLDDTFGTCGK